MLIGKEIQFAIDHKTTGGREYGVVWFTKGTNNGQMENARDIRQINGHVLNTILEGWFYFIYFLCYLDMERLNVTELIVSEGLVEVRQSNVRPSE